MTSLLSSAKHTSSLALALGLILLNSMAIAAVGDPAASEFQVNTYTLADQMHAATAMNAAGDFVVVWESSIQDTDSFSGIYGQRYDVNGVALGSEFQVNSLSGLDNQFPRVAMNDTGAFVVVWEGLDQDGYLHVYSRRFSALGKALGGNKEVTTTPISLSTFSTAPAVAIDSSGNYVVAWENFDDNNNDEDIYARRFTANGFPDGNDYRVNTTIAYDQASVALDMNAAGDYLISWQSDAQDGDANGIYAQLYAAAGTVLKGEFQVNSTTVSDQTTPAVSMNTNGFVVAWQSVGQDGDGKGIYAQRYDGVGTPLGNEFQVNTTAANDQKAPSVAICDDGFIVAWESLGQDGDGKGIYAQRYDSTGATLGGEFQVNTTTAKDQALPAVAMNANSALVVAWQSYGQDKSWNGVFAQRYLGKPVASASNTTSTNTTSDSGSNTSGGGGGSIGLCSAGLLVPILWRRGRHAGSMRRISSFPRIDSVNRP